MAATGPPDLSHLSPAEQAELLALVEAQYGGQGLRDFIVARFPHHIPPRHLDPLIGLFERARHERIRACVSMPPGHAKTVTILRALAWWLMRAPADTCAYATHSDRKAWSESRRARTIARESGVDLRDDTQNVAEWRTPLGGGLLAVGAKGLTGHRVTGVLVVDDPYQDRAEAESVAIRERVWDWFREVAFTRIQNASVIVVHTRWTPDDLIGRLAGMGWEVLNLPAIAEDGDLLGRQEGEVLWPELYPEKVLNESRSILGEWAFAALYQGSPRPRGSAVFGLAHHYDPATLDKTGLRIMIGGDPAATADTRADHSAAVVLGVRGYGADAVGYVLDVCRSQVEIPDFITQVQALSGQWWHAPLAIEAVAGFKAVPQMLQRLDADLRLVEVKMGSDKFTRAQPVAAAWNQGRVLVPTSAPWLKTLLAEVSRFTGVGDAEDDQVDALAHAWNALAGAVEIAAPDISCVQESWTGVAG